MRFLWVGFAGAIGGIARYSIGLSVDQSRFPWATMGINLSGAFLLAFFLAVALGHLPVSVMTPIAVGLIGGFTTFSNLRVGSIHHEQDRAAGSRTDLSRRVRVRRAPGRVGRVFDRPRGALAEHPLQ
jgi:fluoride ion exporter CrcB/FEX